MKILVSGTHGLVGRALFPALSASGHTVVRLVRGEASSANELSYNPSCVEPSLEFVRSMDEARPEAVIHLAGENVARKRWTAAQKERIRNSRVNSTRMLTKAFQRMKAPPRRFLVASAVGYYGNAGEEVLTESSPAGFDFLASVCQQWEESARQAEAAGVEVTNLRFGTVLSREGGALAMMLPGFQLYMGARLGSGEQWMSWISLTDVIHALRFILESRGLSGPINVVSPNPVRNIEFTKALSGALGKPAFMMAPGPLLKAVFGEMAERALLSSQRAVPEELQRAGFQFKHPDIRSALEAELGLRTASSPGEVEYLRDRSVAKG